MAKETEMATVDHEEVKSNLNMTDTCEDGNEKKDPYMTDPIQIDAAMDRRLFWKITRRVLVIQVITYFCQSLDKGILNYASIMGIKSDAHLVGQQVSSSILPISNLHLANKYSVLMVRDNPIYWYPMRRVSTKLASTEIPRGEDTRYQYLYLGRRCSMLSGINQLCVSHGSPISVGIL